MTTRYLVAYPHPSIPPHQVLQICKFKLPTATHNLLDELAGNFPTLSSDLKGPNTTLWMASR